MRKSDRIYSIDVILDWEAVVEMVMEICLLMLITLVMICVATVSELLYFFI